MQQYRGRGKNPNERHGPLCWHSPVLSDLVVVDLGHLLRGAAHEEERDAEEGGGGQHRHREAWDGLQREAHLLHDDSAHQHPHGYCWQINGAWEPHRPGDEW